MTTGARGPMVLVLAKIDARDVYQGDGGVGYDVDSETGEVVGLPKSDHSIVMIGVAAARVNLADRARVRAGASSPAQPAVRVNECEW